MCVKQVRRTVLTTFRDDAAHRLDHFGFMLVKKWPNGGIAFGHQRAAVEQLCGLLEGCEVQLDGGAAHVLQPQHGLTKSSFSQRVAKKFELVGHTEFKARRIGLAGQGQLA